MSEPFAVFGPGIAIVTRTDVSPSLAINIGYAQSFSIDFSATEKDLHGQYQYPLVSARGTIKCTGKLTAAVISGLAWNEAFFGQSFAAGGFAWNIQEPHAVPGSASGYALAVSNAANFDVDLGATYAGSGLPLQRSSGTASGTGYYLEASGSYSFSSYNSGQNILVTYTNATTVGQNLAVANKLIGTTPTFQLDYYTNLNQPTAKPFAVRLFACVGSKLALAAKLEDYLMPEIDFGFYANAAGNVFEMVFPEVS